MKLFNRIFLLFKKHPKKWMVFFALVLLYYFSLPKLLFNKSYSTVLESAEGHLLGASIANDGQWRFPLHNDVPVKFKKSIVAYEDEYFFKHFGFNPFAMFNAYRQNKKQGKIVRGGSTLTQQVIRLHRKNKPRTYKEKLIELVLATRLEFRYSKDKILALYAAHAPFGGNTIGLDAAAWRYFGQAAAELSWAESATLAVLPNAPGLINVNKNRDKLLQKRNALLHKLWNKGVIDKTTYQLSLIEPLPKQTYAIPQIAPHLLSNLTAKQKGTFIKTTIDYNLQINVNELVNTHYLKLKQNQIHNAAVIIVDVHTRKVLAYVGNTPTDNNHQKDVDIITKNRSTGSILKPLLFTSMLNNGTILPNSLVDDIPTQIAGYRPENFNLQYLGAVPASIALARSLNIPAVRMLQDYGLEKFYNDLKLLKLKAINKGANHYGLSLVLGGAESSLWDICRTYTAMASVVNHYDETQGKYFQNEWVDLILENEKSPHFGKQIREETIYDAGSIYTTFKTLLEVNKPEAEENWDFYDNTRPIAWKTGTSFGYRDGWAVGITPDYVVGVWVGNADGEGRPELTGLNTAAPILFDLFKLLPKGKWFAVPYDELQKIPICSKSGYRATELCEQIDSVLIPQKGLKTPPCPFHKLIHLDATQTYQVNTSCEPEENIVHKRWFILPPTQAYYYQLYNPNYKLIPPFRADCIQNGQEVMDFIVPFANEQIFLPKDFDGKQNLLVLKVKHIQPESKIFWYVDQTYIQTTTHIHEITIQPIKGIHSVTIVDEKGNQKSRRFKIN